MSPHGNFSPQIHILVELVTNMRYGPQVVHIGSNQSVSYKTQHGETYGRNTKCVVNFKVSLFSTKNPSTSYCIYFVHRSTVLVHLWWCLAQSLTSPTRRQTARAKGEISSLLESRGLEPFSQQIVPFMGVGGHLLDAAIVITEGTHSIALPRDFQPNPTYPVPYIAFGAIPSQTAF